MAEASRYAGVHPSTARAWFHRKNTNGAPLLESEYAQSEFPGLSFMNLIELLVVGQLRKRGIPLREISDARRIMTDKFKIRHAFCHKELYIHGKKVFIRVAEEKEMAHTTLYQVVTRQGFFEEAMRPHLEHITYDDASRLARRWMIRPGILIDPAVRFGVPVMAGTRIDTEVLARQYYAEDQNAGLVAELYDIKPEHVLRAVEFYEDFRPRKAA